MSAPRWCVTFADGVVMDVGADGAASAASRALRVHGCSHVLSVVTLSEWVDVEHARFTRELDELGAMIAGLVTS